MWKLLLRDCKLLLKDDISSSESSNPRIPSPDIEQGEIFEFEEAAQIYPEPEQLNEMFDNGFPQNLIKSRFDQN